MVVVAAAVVVVAAAVVVVASVVVVAAAVFFYNFYSNGINMHRCQYNTVQSFNDYKREAKRTFLFLKLFLFSLAPG